MKIRRLLALLLAAGFPLSAFLACRKDAAPAESSDTTPSASTSADTEPEKLFAALPEGYSLEGQTVTIMCYTEPGNASESYVSQVGSMDSSDQVEYATYLRNTAVEERLACQIEFLDSDINVSKTSAAITADILSEDHAYDVISGIQWATAGLVLENMFYNVAEAPHLSLDREWWNSAFMAKTTANPERMYCLVGDISLDLLRCTSVMYYNKTLMADLGQNEEQLLDTVFEGGWTLDESLKYIKNSYADLNKNNEADNEDRFGLSLALGPNVDSYFFNAGFRLTEQTSDGIEFTLETERNYDIASKIFSYINDTIDVCFDKEYAVPIANFSEGRSLFLSGFFYTGEYLRDTTDNYGVLPHPKYHESQSDYLSLVHDIVPFYYIPINTVTLDPACAVLECLAEYGGRHVTPIYYESALKLKYINDSDDVSSRIIDMVHDASVTDISFIYPTSFGEACYMMRYYVGDGVNNFGERAAAFRDKAAVGIEALEAAFHN